MVDFNFNTLDSFYEDEGGKMLLLPHDQRDYERFQDIYMNNRDNILVELDREVEMLILDYSRK